MMWGRHDSVRVHVQRGDGAGLHPGLGVFSGPEAASPLAQEDGHVVRVPVGHGQIEQAVAVEVGGDHVKGKAARAHAG